MRTPIAWTRAVVVKGRRRRRAYGGTRAVVEWTIICKSVRCFLASAHTHARMEVRAYPHNTYARTHVRMHNSRNVRCKQFPLCRKLLHAAEFALRGACDHRVLCQALDHNVEQKR